jgi:hypothetical protein
MIYAGSAAEVRWGDGDWIFVDVGFSSGDPTCGLLIREGSAECYTFAEAKEKVIQEGIKTPVLNLVVEAPLSVCFRSGNPTRRKLEIEGAQARPWYTGAGCAVMVASMYLLCELWATETSIRLFEGFVSHKDKSTKRSNHQQDVELLRSVVMEPFRFQDSIYEADRLKENPADDLVSAFRAAGLDCGGPAVIKPNRIIAV